MGNRRFRNMCVKLSISVVTEYLRRLRIDSMSKQDISGSGRGGGGYYGRGTQFCLRLNLGLSLSLRGLVCLLKLRLFIYWMPPIKTSPIRHSDPCPIDSPRCHSTTEPKHKEGKTAKTFKLVRAECSCCVRCVPKCCCVA